MDLPSNISFFVYLIFWVLRIMFLTLKFSFFNLFGNSVSYRSTSYLLWLSEVFKPCDENTRQIYKKKNKDNIRSCLIISDSFIPFILWLEPISLTTTCLFCLYNYNKLWCFWLNPLKYFLHLLIDIKTHLNNSLEKHKSW